MNPLRSTWAKWVIGLTLAATCLRSADLSPLERDLLPRAKAGDAEAQFKLGQAYATSPQLRMYELKNAELWLRKAADQEHFHAILYLANFYLHHLEIVTDAGEPAPYLARAAAFGMNQPGTRLGIMLWMGERGLPIDRPRAVTLLRASAIRGDEVAVLALASHALDGIGMARDPAKARELLAYATRHRSLLAHQQLKLLEPNARRLLQTSEVESGLNALAKKGDAEAKMILAVSMLYDLSFGTYNTHDGLNQRLARAHEMLEEAAAQGQPEAQTRLGTILAQGRGVTPNLAAAVARFEQAAGTDSLAQFNLAIMILDGKVPGADPTRAVSLLESACVENGDAAFELGNIYYEGRLRPWDLARAAKYYSQAAELGNAKAMVNLGVMAFNSENCTADPVVAVRWWLLSSVFGESKGQAMVERVWPRLSARDRATALAQVRHWVEFQQQARGADFPVLAVK